MAAGSTYTRISTTTLASATPSYTFSSIPSTYTDLVIVANAATSTAGSQNVMRFNSSTGNYSTTEIYGTGSSAYSYRFTGQSYMWFSSGVGLGSTLGQNNFIVNIQNYANTSTYKTALMRLNSNSGTYPGTVAAVGLWSNTAAINSITLYAETSGTVNWVVGSTFTLYGIAAA